jgi:hypothetical protein
MDARKTWSQAGAIGLAVALGAALFVGALPATAQDAAPPATQMSTNSAYGFPGTAWPGQPILGSSSSYVAFEDGVSATFDTTGLEPGHVVTMWWVVFNHPELCTNGEGGLRCGEPDLLTMGGDEAIEGSVLHAGGHIVGPDGAGHYGSFLSTGDTSGVMIAGPGLTNPLGADVHLVLRDHGPVQEGLLVDALASYGGGCIEPPDGTGTPGDFDCVEVQFTAHEPTLTK